MPLWIFDTNRQVEKALADSIKKQEIQIVRMTLHCWNSWMWQVGQRNICQGWQEYSIGISSALVRHSHLGITQFSKHRSQAGVNWSHSVMISWAWLQYQHTCTREWDFAIAVCRNFFGPAALSVVQIEPMSYQAVMCGQLSSEESRLSAKPIKVSKSRHNSWTKL